MKEDQEDLAVILGKVKGQVQKRGHKVDRGLEGLEKATGI